MADERSRNAFMRHNLAVRIEVFAPWLSHPLVFSERVETDAATYGAMDGARLRSLLEAGILALEDELDRTARGEAARIA
jgi:hypothetical protein